MKRRMKKNAIRTRTRAASPVSVQRSSGSASRERGGRSTSERPPRTEELSAPASIARSALRGRAAERLPVALQALHLGLRLALDLVGQRRVLQLRGDLLARAERVVEPVLDELGLV